MSSQYLHFSLSDDDADAAPPPPLHNAPSKDPTDLHPEEEVMGTGDQPINRSYLGSRTLTMGGCLSDQDDVIDLHGSYEEEFKKFNGYVSDSLVAFLINHTCWGLFSRYRNAIRVISPIKFASWNITQEFRSNDQPLSWPATSQWKKHKYVAFPVIDDGHFTLGIAVNTSWRSIDDSGTQPHWTCFHFNSLKIFEGHQRLAHQFASFATETPKEDITLIDVPVPEQPHGSNTCGLCVHHFFRTFFDNVEHSIEFCTKTSRGLGIDNPSVKTFWQAERYANLRSEAWDIMRFYDSMFQVYNKNE